jgi:Spy/CpxP family protein refolding chaperone
MKIQTIALLALTAIATCSTSALAAPGGGPGPLFAGGPGFPGPGMMLEHMADHLDLDDAQRDSIRNILEAAKPELDALREQVRSNREALDALGAEDPEYSTVLNNIAISNGQLATEGTLLFTRIRTEVHAVLTDEQREKLARSKKRMHRAMERRVPRS